MTKQTSEPARSHAVLRRRLSAVLTATAAAATVLSIAAPPAGASEIDPDAKGVTVIGSATDPDDTLGRFDIGSVRDQVVRIDRRHTLMTYRVHTRTPFASQRLDAEKRNFVIELNRDNEPGSERNVRISSRDGIVVAEVISNATREVIATVEVARPNDHVIQIMGSRRLIGARSYFWTSNFHAPRSPGCGFGDGFPIVCQDSVPQRGWLRLQAPAWPQLG